MKTKTMLLLLVATTTNRCTVVSCQMPSLLVPHSCSSFYSNVELHSCILLLSFHSACYLSNSGGFHAIKAKNGRSLGGGSIYIYKRNTLRGRGLSK